nr:response regulator [Acetatifactor sp.]
MHTLLIVEDEKMIRQGIKAMVQRSGVPIDIILECGNGEVALEILKSQPVDVMFTDIRMPKMDGIALVKAMQELPHRPLTVAVSGYDEFSYAVEMLRAGVREYILKPVDREQVKQILEKLDAEITQQKEKTEHTRTIGGQQLKHLMQDGQISEAELAAIVSEFGDSFLK